MTSKDWIITLFIVLGVSPTESQDNFFFNVKPEDTQVIEGQDTTLRCNVNNRKHIQFQWTINDRLLYNDSRRFQEDSDLRILRASKQEDSGSFSCTATNVTTRYSIKTPAAQLNILWISKEGTVKLRQPNLADDIVERSNISLRCRIGGNPKPQYEWYRNKIRIFQTEAAQKSRPTADRLRITLATAADNGVYSCRAKNDAGEIDSWTNFVLNIRGTDTAYLDLTSFNDTLLVTKNSPARLNCNFRNAGLTDWYYGDRKLDNTTRWTIFPNGSLAFNSVRPRDAGTYKCIGMNSNGPAQPFTAELVLASLGDLTPDSFEPRLEVNKPTIVANGQRFEATCYPPDGIPAPTQQWEGPTGAVITDRGRIFVHNSKLVISNTMREDRGNYTCVVSNMAGEKRKHLSLIVSVPPIIIANPIAQSVDEDKEAMFECQYNGSPYPVTQITWLKELQPVPKGDPRLQLRQNDRTGRLTITSVRLSDQGYYSCRINTSGHNPTTTQPAQLKVQKKLKFKPVPIDTKLELGATAKIHCIAEGQAIPTVKWLKTGSINLPSHIQDSSGELTFNNVQYSDAGQYSCVAVGGDDVINATIQVSVVIKPSFAVKPANTTAYEGYSTILHCVATGDPQPAIRWVKNNKVLEIHANRMKVYSNGSLFFHEVHRTDSGEYGCIAGNSWGFVRAEALLRVAGHDQYVPGDGVHDGSMQNGKSDSPGEQEGLGLMKTVIIAVCSAVAYLALVIGLTICCSIRIARKRKRKTTEEAAKGHNGDVPKEAQSLMAGMNGSAKAPLSNNKSEDVRSNVSSLHSHSSQSHGSRKRESYNNLKFPRHDIQTVAKLGKGMFGEVFLAKARGIRDDESETLVVIKSLLSKDETHHFDFRHEMDMFSKLGHEYVVKLLGVCRDTEPVYMILEYLDWGDLKQFLMATNKNNGRHVKVPPLTLAQKVTICNQIALGMEHLANHRFTHKDLAARNIMLSSSLNVKISSLGLSKDIYASEYYTHHNIAIPLRWLPGEAIFEDDYSTKSDVWAYGIFVWEMLTSGDVPYRARKNEEVLEGIKSGELRPELMPYWPEELQSLMIRCWNECPKDRPSFSEIAVLIAEIQVDSDV